MRSVPLATVVRADMAGDAPIVAVTDSRHLLHDLSAILFELANRLLLLPLRPIRLALGGLGLLGLLVCCPLDYLVSASWAANCLHRAAWDELRPANLALLGL